MLDAPFGLALAAGVLAAVNPCGFALLPAYLSFLILGEASSRWVAVGRALTLTGAMTLGFMAVFGLFGLAIAPVAGSVQEHLPWFTIGLGIVLAALGVWLLLGRTVPGLRLPFGSGGSSRPQARKAITRSVPSMVAFGASYAIASLGCAIGPFLGIVGASFEARSLLAGVGVFLAYALGMGLLVGVAAVAISLAQNAFVHRLRRFTSLVSRIAGGLLVVVGAYVAYYGWYEVRLFSGADVDDPLISFVEGVQGEVSAWLDSVLSTVSFVAS